MENIQFLNFFYNLTKVSSRHIYSNHDVYLNIHSVLVPEGQNVGRHAGVEFKGQKYGRLEIGVNKCMVRVGQNLGID